MPILGSDGGFQADNRGGIIDEQGNTIVTADTAFAASPLGIAARTQALYGIPNANFNLTPPDPDSPIVANQNDLPYWSIEELSDGVMTATTVFDATTQTWGVQIDPGTAATGSSLALTTRSYLITDDNLALRQKALAVLSKSGTAAVSTEWNLQLSAIYYDSTDTALSTAVIGTALDTGTWTSFAGTTTPGGSAINAAAQYVDLTFTLTTTAAVTGSAKATIKSLLLTTSSPTTGGGLLITETFTAGTTWTKPTGVDYLVAALVVGAGGGGGGGGVATGTALNGTAIVSGGSGGGGGGWVFVQNLYIPDATYSIGVGAGGVGGTAAEAYIKGVGTATTAVARIGGDASAGGASTFGTIITSAGGGQGIGGTANSLGATTTSAKDGGTAGATTVSIYGAEAYTGGTGGGKVAGTLGPNTQASSAPFTFAIYPYSSTPNNAQAGSAASGTVSSSDLAIGTAVGGAIGFCGGGASGQIVRAYYNDSLPASSAQTYVMQAATGNGGGGGAGASAGGVSLTATGTYYVRGGQGGNAATNSGGGGGGGGGAALRLRSSLNASLDATAAAGGNGASGYVVIAYVA